MELVKGICVDLTHNNELKLKIKSTKGSKTQQIHIKHLYQKQETNKPKKVLLGFDDIFGRNIDKTHIDSEIKRLEHNMNQLKLQ